LGLGVDPVQVLEDHEERLHLGFAEEETFDRLQRPLPALGGVEVLPMGILDRHVQECQQRRQSRLQRTIQREKPSCHLLPDVPDRVAVGDLEVALEEIDHGQVARGLPV
jgi:hypothetical protein